MREGKGRGGEVVPPTFWEKVTPLYILYLHRVLSMYHRRNHGCKSQRGPQTPQLDRQIDTDPLILLLHPFPGSRFSTIVSSIFTSFVPL